MHFKSISTLKKAKYSPNLNYYGNMFIEKCLQSLGYVFSNSQKYIVCVKIITFSFMPKIIRILNKDHVP